MKSILFVIPSYQIGGTPVSVKNLILLLDKKKYNISILTLYDEGPLKNLFQFEKKVKSSNFLRYIVSPSWKNFKGVQRMMSGSIRILLRFKLCQRFIFKYAINKVVDNKYDTIISCQEGITTTLVSFAKIQNKIAWVRCDYDRVVSIYPNYYNFYNAIVCVSQETTKHFLRNFPQYQYKTYCINNPQDSSYIISQSLLPIDDGNFKCDKVSLISIGRICDIKRFDKIPQIAKNLKDQGLDFYWYIIGSGESILEQVIINKIKLFKLEDNVILLGAKSNPYPYIRYSNLLISLSKSEACPRVINEAKILHIPTISTDYPTANEFIENGVSGMIASIDDIEKIIKKVLEDKELYDKLVKNISTFHFDNVDLLKRINSLI